MKISEAQKRISEIYSHKDKERGVAGTFMYFSEEVGELATALREEDKASQASEFADVFAWLMSLASLAEVDLEQAFLEKYLVCSGCKKNPCTCNTKV